MDHPHLPGLLAAAVRTHPSRPALTVRRSGAWVSTSYAELGAQVRRLAEAFARGGIEAGDRVALFGGNRPEWTLADLALLTAGAVPVTVYSTSTPQQLAYVLRDAGAVGIVVAGAAEAERLAAGGEDLPALRLVASMDDGVAGASSLRELMAQSPQGEEAARAAAEVERRLAAMRRDDLATIVYTSGTTGDPKGVCLHHGNLLDEIAAIHERFDMAPGLRSMCFLPLSHVFERAWTFVVLDHGMENAYVTNPKAVAEAMVEMRPDVFCSVPRLYEKVYAVAHEQAGTGLTRRIFDEALKIGLDVESRVRRGDRVPAYLRAVHAAADRLVLHRVRDAVGGPKVVMASGGAPLRQEVIRFFLAAGLDVYEGYGLSETAPMISCNAPGQTRIGSVGRPVPGCEVRIAADGEIQARGGNVFSGYWNRPQETREAFVDGWFRTGDIGHLDDDGYLYVTDRIKDLIITAQGKNIAPGPLETRLTADPLIDSAVVVGDDRKYLVALLGPSWPDLEAYAAARGWDTSDRAALVARPEVQQRYDELVTAAGAGLAPYEQIQKFRLIPDELTMDDGAITPTLKVKRKVVAQRYAHLVEEMYGPHGARA